MLALAWLFAVLPAQTGTPRVYLEPSPLAERLAPILSEELGAGAIAREKIDAGLVLVIARSGDHFALVLSSTAGVALLERTIVIEEHETAALRAAALMIEGALDAQRPPMPRVQLLEKQPAKLGAPNDERQPPRHTPPPLASKTLPERNERDASQTRTQGELQPARDATQTPAREALQPPRTTAPAPAQPEDPADLTQTPRTLRLRAGTGFAFLLTPGAPQEQLELGAHTDLGAFELGVAVSTLGAIFNQVNVDLPDGTPGLNARLSLYETTLLAAYTLPLDAQTVTVRGQAGFGAAYQSVRADPAPAFDGDTPVRDSASIGLTARFAVLAAYAFSRDWSVLGSAGLHLRATRTGAALPADFPKGTAALDSGYLATYVQLAVEHALF